MIRHCREAGGAWVDQVCGRCKRDRAATRWPKLFTKQLREGVGARDCLNDRYGWPAHNGGHCLY